MRFQNKVIEGEVTMQDTKNHFYEDTIFADEILLSEAKSHFSRVMRKLQKYIFFYKANVTTPKNLEKKSSKEYKRNTWM